jgi:cytochrome P450
MWFVSVGLGVLLFSFYRLIKFWVLKPWSIHQDLWKQGIPGQYTPVIGELLRIREADLSGNPFSYTRQLVKKFGSYYHTSFDPFACLNISDPSLIEGVLKTNVRAHHKSLLAQLLLGALLGNDNLILAEGERHARHRRLIAHAFQHKNIHSMISLMVESTQHILNKWMQATKNTEQVLTIDIHQQMSSLTLDIVTGCVFGSETVQDNQAHDVIYRDVTLALNEAEKRIFTLVAMTPILNRLPLPSKRRIEKAREDIRCIVQRIIDQRKKGLSRSACKGVLFSLLFLLCAVSINRT